MSKEQNKGVLPLVGKPKQRKQVWVTLAGETADRVEAVSAITGLKPSAILRICLAAYLPRLEAGEVPSVKEAAA